MSLRGGPNGKFRAVISENQTVSTDSATSFGTMGA